MTRILVVTTSFPLKPGDSLSPFLWEFCVKLKRRGWDLTVIAPHHKGIKKEEVWEGIKIRRFKYLPEKMEILAYSGGLLPGIKKNPFKILGVPFIINSMYRETLRAVSEQRFDIVNIHWLFPAAFWLKRFYNKSRSAIVLTGHGTDVQLTRKFPFNWFSDSALKVSAGLTLNSEYMRRVLEGRAIPEKTVIIPMGTDIEDFRPGKDRPSRSKKVLFIGRLIKQKGIDLLLKAFISLRHSFPEAELEIIGDGPEKGSLLKALKSADLPGNVKFVDAVPHSLLPEKYQGARVLALPSLIGEGFGMTVAEAAACGIPVITFGLGGTAEIVKADETGLVVGQDAESLSEGLIRLFSDDTLTDNLGKCARERIKNYFGWEQISEKFDRFFGEVLENQEKNNPAP